MSDSDTVGSSADEGGAAERPPRAREDEDIFTAGPLADVPVAGIITADDIAIDSWMVTRIVLEILLRLGMIFELATQIPRSVSTQSPMRFVFTLASRGTQGCLHSALNICGGAP